MIPGVTVAMAGQDWMVPPLTLGQLRRLMPKLRELTAVGSEMGEAQIDILVEIVDAALQRNYPDISPQTVEDLLDLGNAGAVLNAVLTGSGLRPRESALGEEPAVTRSSGQPSTAFSPPPADTATP